MTAPVVLFVYNRLRHTKRCVESLQKNYLAKDSNLYIFSDGANPGQELEVAHVREYLKTITGFRSVNIYQNKNNIGCAASIIAGVSQIFEGYDSVIVIEDDLIVSDNFLSYMNAALEQYEGKNKWSVSGWGMDLDFPKDGSDVWYSLRGSSWGWGTWRARWESADWNVKDWPLNGSQKKRFARGGADLPRMLDKQMAGKISSWSIRFDYAQSKSSMMTVYPKVSKAINIGAGGTHMDIDPGWPVTLDTSGKKDFNFNGWDYPDVNREFLQYFGLKHRVKNRLKNLL